MIVWGFQILFHERVSLTDVTTMIIQKVYLMSCDGQNGARSVKSREESNRNSPGSVSLGCWNLFPVLSQCCWLQHFCWNTFDSRRWTKQEHFLHEHLDGGQESRQGCAWSGIWLCTSLSAGVAPSVLQWPQPFPFSCSKCINTLSVRFYSCRCFQVCLHSCHWWSGFFWLHFVCLFVCSDVWVLLPLFNCLFYLSPKQLVFFRSWMFVHFLRDFPMKKKIYFLLIYYNGTKTTKLQTYEAFLLELRVVQFVKEVGNVSFLIICFALESSLCPQTMVVHWLSGLWWQELLGPCFQKIVAYNWNNT